MIKKKKTEWKTEREYLYQFIWTQYTKSSSQTGDIIIITIFSIYMERQWDTRTYFLCVISPNNTVEKTLRYSQVMHKLII